MTETPSASQAEKSENVTRGAVFALGAIPIAVVAFAIFGSFGIYPFIVGIATPFVAGWLYRLGSGGTLTRAGWVPFIVVSMVAVLLGSIAGAMGTVSRIFGFGTQFWNALGINLRNFQPGGEGFFTALGLVLGVVGIVITLRQVASTPAQQIAANTAQWTPPPADPATAAAAAPATPAPAAPDAPASAAPDAPASAAPDAPASAAPDAPAPAAPAETPAPRPEALEGRPTGDSQPEEPEKR